MTGEAEVTLSATGKDSVTIWCTKLDHNVDKQFIDIQVPRNKNVMDSEVPPTTYIIDIGRINQSITIQGHLVDESSEAAIVKKTNLLKLAYYSREVTITWGTGNNREQSYTGNINKIMVTERAGIIGTQQTGYESEKEFDVQLSLLIGDDK